MNIIEIKNLKFKYDDHSWALDDVSFNIKQGQYVTIIGHNGSGKSTLARLIAGLLEKDSGEIIIDGKTLNEENLTYIRNFIGIVFQNPDNQFIGSSVCDDIAFGLENIQVPPKEMQAIIEKFSKSVNVYELLDKEPQSLSGGQKQRVAIAGVLAMNPKILILDEATSMLDPKGKQEIKELIINLHQEKKRTIISITHDIEEAIKSDYVIILNEGKVFKEGKPQEVLDDIAVMQKIKLDVPYGIYLKDSFLKAGIKLKEYNDIDEVVESLCQLR